MEAVTSGTMTLKDAVNETMKEWASRVDDTHYVLGSVMGPHPFPMLSLIHLYFPIAGVEVNRPVEPQIIEKVELELFGQTYPEPVRVSNPELDVYKRQVLFDVGCIKDGYCSDMTRTFYFKEVSETHRHIYDTVRSANETAISKIKPGVMLCELDKTARDLIDAEGYGPNFNHRLGHFIGLSEHEYGDV